MNKTEELVEKIEELKKNPYMTVDEAVKELGSYDSAGEFILLITDIVYRLTNNDVETAKEYAKVFLGHCLFVLDKVGQGDIEKAKNELLKAMQEQVKEAFPQPEEKPVEVIPTNNRKKKKK